MTINLKPETEELVREELRNGHFASVDKMIVEGVQAKRAAKSAPHAREPKTAAEAVAHIRQLRQGNRLPAGMTLKDFINEGRA